MVAEGPATASQETARKVNRALWLVGALGIIAVTLAAAHPKPPHPDLAFYLYAARRMLGGAVLYRDVVEINPPLIIWLNIPAVLIAELGGDEYARRIVLIHDSDKNPAGSGVYFVSGDITDASDLRRAGIEQAMAAVICPADATNEADMRSILAVMAIE